MPKEYIVRLTHLDNGMWEAATPKTKSIGETGPKALRALADMLEMKAKYPDHKDILDKFSDLVGKVNAATGKTGNPFIDHRTDKS